MDKYFKLIRQSFAHTFSKKEYKLWWKIPFSERFKYGLMSMVVLSPGLVALVSSRTHYLRAVAIYFVYAILVYVPISELWVEKLKLRFK